MIEPTELNRRLGSMQRDQGDEGIDRSSLSTDPFEQFRIWMQDAIDANLEMPNIMAVATADRRGRPSVRITLLKGFDGDGFVFFSNYESQKGRDIAENPYAALVFYWPELSRQVRVEGSVEQTTVEESLAYFRTRSRGSQIGAWASHQSTSIPDREALLEQVSEMESRFPDDDIPVPPYWGGLRLIPDRFEFWKSRRSRLHDRFSYSLQDDGSWLIERLSP